MLKDYIILAKAECDPWFTVVAVVTTLPLAKLVAWFYRRKYQVVEIREDTMTPNFVGELKSLFY